MTTASDPSTTVELPLAALLRVQVGVTDLERAAQFYGALLGTPGRRVSRCLHYFTAGAATLACYDAEAAGDDTPHFAAPLPVTFVVPDLMALYHRCLEAGLAGPASQVRPDPDTGERTLYIQDPFGNPLGFIDAPRAEEREPSVAVS